MDSAEHTVFHCPEWGRERVNLCSAIQGEFTPDTMVECMLSSEDNWRAIVSFILNIMTAKEKAERARENAGRR